MKHMILYRFLWLLLLPVLVVWIILRLISKKEDANRIGERFGFSQHPRPEGDLIHFHCASVGESLSILPLIDNLLIIDPDLNILVTTGTKTSAKLMADKLPDGCIHQYVPLDLHPCVTHFMYHWHPDLSIFVESEFWPEMLWQSPHPILLNARISDKSFQRYLKIKWFFEPLISRFGTCLGQTQKDAERLHILGGKRVEAPGNLKFDAPPLEFDANELRKLHSITKDRTVVVAASTHSGEDEIFADIHNEIKSDHPGVLTIIIPRHPNRGSDIAAMLKKQNFRVHMRSQNELPDHKTDVYVADTIGEMGLWYNLAGAVVIGGSFVEHGGQNPLEPLRIGVPTICGPHMFNFTEMMQQLDEKGIIHQVNDAPTLLDRLISLLKDPQPDAQTTQKRMAELAGGTQHAVKTIMKLLESITAK